MIVALEFYVRCLNLRNNLPIPCSFCLENDHGDRKVVTLHEAYRHPEVVAVRHWHLSDCVEKQSLPVLSEKLVPKQDVFDHDFVVVPNHRIMGYHNPCVPSSLNFLSKPMSQDQYSSFYAGLLRTDIHLHYKETWVFREFLKAYMPFMASFVWNERDEFSRIRDLMGLVRDNQLDLWQKWLHWRKYMIDFTGLPGEVAFCREYGRATFNFF